MLHLYTNLTGERGKKCVEKLWCDETHILINRTKRYVSLQQVEGLGVCRVNTGLAVL